MKIQFKSLLGVALLTLGQVHLVEAQVCETLINLTFSPVNSGDVAAHPNVSSISPWTNGSETLPDPFGSGTYYMPDSDFGNGYAGLTVPNQQFGFSWGFEGGFETTGAEDWSVCLISFDYDILGHNGEGLLSLGLGSWDSTAPLPSTGTQGAGPIFLPVGTAERATGTVTFDFENQVLTVSRIGYADYTTAFTDTLLLEAGFHDIDMLVTNTLPASDGGWDVNSDSAGTGVDAFYRIDNFRVLAAQVPEPSSLLTLVLGSGLLLFRRRKRA